VDGDEVTFNTAEGRNKPQNLRRDPRIVVSVQDRNDPQAYAVFHGKARVTETGADDHIDKLAKRFLNADKYPFRRPGEKRLIVRISVDNSIPVTSSKTGRTIHELFFGRLVAENGKIKLLRESVNLVEVALGVFPNGLADYKAPSEHKT
jgi:PPOX class probable F420-dependent enzyme